MHFCQFIITPDHANCLLLIAHRPVSIAHFPLPITHCTLPIAYCPLPRPRTSMAGVCPVRSMSSTQSWNRPRQKQAKEIKSHTIINGDHLYLSTWILPGYYIFLAFNSFAGEWRNLYMRSTGTQERGLCALLFIMMLHLRSI